MPVGVAAVGVHTYETEAQHAPSDWHFAGGMKFIKIKLSEKISYLIDMHTWMALSRIGRNKGLYVGNKSWRSTVNMNCKSHKTPCKFSGISL